MVWRSDLLVMENSFHTYQNVRTYIS
jgi:hypothetical protein